MPSTRCTNDCGSCAGGHTSLLISHRLGVVREADLVVVIRDGRVTERSTHVDLMARGSTYAKLFDLQAAGYREAVP